MKLVIDIPDEMYQALMADIKIRDPDKIIFKAIALGKPIPKGHDALIDRGELKKIIQENDPLSMTGFSVRLCDIYKATPIIEADKEDK